jgi:Serine proteases of the peptidase family S9A
VGAAENKVTYEYLDQIPYRKALFNRLSQLYNYPKISAPTRRGEWFAFTKNDGLQNQSVWYIQKGLNGTPDLLLDPNKFSTDGTSRLGAFSWSPNGKYVLYGVSQGGSDWNDLYVLDVATKKPMADHIQWVKNGGGSWMGEEGFFYSRYPEPEKGRELYTKNENQKVYYHKLGTSQADDQLIYEDNANPQRFQSVGVTEDERYAILNVSERGKGKNGNAIYFRDLKANSKTFTPIVSDISNDSYNVIDNVGDKFLIETNHGAPNSKVVLVRPGNQRVEGRFARAA